MIFFKYLLFILDKLGIYLKFNYVVDQIAVNTKKKTCTKYRNYENRLR